MPYMLEGNCVYKKNPDGSKGKSMGCSENAEKAKAHMRALYANTKESMIQEMSFFISRASFETNESDPNRRMRFRMSSSDVEKDLSGERMSLELFDNFKRRIDEEDIPEVFKSVICEENWCGGMPYVSVAHYKSGISSKNVPGYIEDIYIDGNVLKAKGFCYDSPLGRATFNSLLDDQTKKKSGVEVDAPVRVSIGFLDLKHKHAPDGGQEFIFERSELGQICPLCEKGIGDKIYLDGVLVHEALTRVPMNPRTEMTPDILEQKSMDEITTRKDDARSIVGDLADTLDVDEVEEKSRILVVKAAEGMPEDGMNAYVTTQGSEPAPYVTDIKKCYDPNVDSFDQSCLDTTLNNMMTGIRNSFHVAVKSIPEDVVTSMLETAMKSIRLSDKPVVEESTMEEKTMDAEHKKEMEKEMESDMEDKKEKKEEKSLLETSFETLKSVIVSKGKRDDVQSAFNQLAEAVEKTYVPDEVEVANDKVMDMLTKLSGAVESLTVQVAQLKAQKPTDVANPVVPKSRSLFVQPTITPTTPTGQQLGPHGRPILNGRELTQIEAIALKSTGAIS